MIRKSLICTIPEATDDVQDAISIRSNPDGSVLIDVLVDIKRFSVNLNDVSEAVQAIREFNIENKDEGHSTMHISEVEHIPELEVMSLDNIPEKILDTNTKI